MEKESAFEGRYYSTPECQEVVETLSRLEDIINSRGNEDSKKAADDLLATVGAKLEDIDRKLSQSRQPIHRPSGPYDPNRNPESDYTIPVPPVYPPGHNPMQPRTFEGSEKIPEPHEEISDAPADE